MDPIRRGFLPGRSVKLYPDDDDEEQILYTDAKQQYELLLASSSPLRLNGGGGGAGGVGGASALSGSSSLGQTLAGTSGVLPHNRRPVEKLPLKVELLNDALKAPGGAVLGDGTSPGVKKHSWGGVPTLYRATIWRLLLGYTSTNSLRLEKDLKRKRQEYHEYALLYHGQDGGGALPHEQAILRQLELDLPRHQMAIFHIDPLVRRVSRCLYLWAIRYPAVGYMQGMDDIVCIFFITFLAEALHFHTREMKKRRYQRKQQLQREHTLQQQKQLSKRGSTSSLGDGGEVGTAEDDEWLLPSPSTTTAASTEEDSEVKLPGSLPQYTAAAEREAVDALRVASCTEAHEIGPMLVDLPAALLDSVEADTYWAAGRMLSWVQDHFTLNQPGVIKLVGKITALVNASHPTLMEELEEEGIIFYQFGYQWAHCLLVRELPLNLSMLLWDTYLTLGDAFATFHVYICAALLIDVWAHVKNCSPDVIQQQLKHLAWTPPDYHGPPRDEKWMETIISAAYLLELQYPQFRQNK